MLGDEEETGGKDRGGGADVESVVRVTSGANDVAQAAVVPAFFPAPLFYDGLELRGVYTSRSLEHNRGGFGKYISTAVEVGEVQTDEQGTRLDVRHLVCKEVGNGLSNFIGRCRLRVACWPEACKKRFEVDHGELLAHRGRLRLYRGHRNDAGRK
jgi:hypothetical protein